MARLVTSGELAKELGLSLRTIQRYIANRVITPEFRTAGGHTRWDPAKVRAELKSNINED